mmetsp:Transcript_29734/g.60776  ORF Transcript_29734/g.60776 Transcript_29734/m.60776 type:complete len:80 (+) Transcript_29734:196-435(+)
MSVSLHRRQHRYFDVTARQTARIVDAAAAIPPLGVDATVPLDTAAAHSASGLGGDGTVGTPAGKMKMPAAAEMTISGLA